MRSTKTIDDLFNHINAIGDAELKQMSDDIVIQHTAILNNTRRLCLDAYPSLFEDDLTLSTPLVVGEVRHLTVTKHRIVYYPHQLKYSTYMGWKSVHNYLDKFANTLDFLTSEYLTAASVAEILNIQSPLVITSWLEGGKFPGSRHRASGRWKFSRHAVFRIKAHLDGIKDRNRRGDLAPPDRGDIGPLPPPF